MKAFVKKKKPAIVKGFAELFRPVPPQAVPYLKRMQLEEPKSVKEKFLRKVVLSALRETPQSIVLLEKELRH